MGFSHIQKHKNRLILWCLGQLMIDPRQLAGQTPGITGEVKALKRCAQDGPRAAAGIKPVHSSRTNRAVTLPAKTLDHIGALQLKTAFFRAHMAGERHPKQLARLGVEHRFLELRPAWGESHPKGSVAAIGEVAGRLGAMECPDLRQMRNRSIRMGSRKRVVAA
jgi:hypothetical protein